VPTFSDGKFLGVVKSHSKRGGISSHLPAKGQKGEEGILDGMVMKKGFSFWREKKKAGGGRWSPAVKPTTNAGERYI